MNTHTHSHTPTHTHTHIHTCGLNILSTPDPQWVKWVLSTVAWGGQHGSWTSPPDLKTDQPRCTSLFAHQLVCSTSNALTCSFHVAESCCQCWKCRKSISIYIIIAIIKLQWCFYVNFAKIRTICYLLTMHPATITVTQQLAGPPDQWCVDSGLGVVPLV